jgi:hypothetical protein
VSDLNGFLVTAYIVMWVGLIGYGVRLFRLTRDSRRYLDDVMRDGRKS